MQADGSFRHQSRVRNFPSRMDLGVSDKAGSVTLGSQLAWRDTASGMIRLPLHGTDAKTTRNTPFLKLGFAVELTTSSRVSLAPRRQPVARNRAVAYDSHKAFVSFQNDSYPSPFFFCPAPLVFVKRVPLSPRLRFSITGKSSRRHSIDPSRTWHP